MDKSTAAVTVTTQSDQGCSYLMTVKLLCFEWAVHVWLVVAQFKKHNSKIQGVFCWLLDGLILVLMPLRPALSNTTISDKIGYIIMIIIINLRQPQIHG